MFAFQHFSFGFRCRQELFHCFHANIVGCLYGPNYVHCDSTRRYFCAQGESSLEEINDKIYNHISSRRMSIYIIHERMKGGLQ